MNMTKLSDTPRVAYVISGFPITFLVNEVEAHRQAGWKILPLSSSAPIPPDSLSSLEKDWREHTVYRPQVATAFLDVVRTVVHNPVKTLRVLGWLMRLALASPSECMKALYEIGAACHFAPICRDFGVEHLHVHFASRSLSLGLMLGILLDLPVTCTAHAFDLYTRGARSLRFRLRQCPAIATISEFNVRYLQDKCGEEIARRCTVVRCGVDLDRFKGLDRRPVAGRLLCVTRLTPHKGLDVAIDACGLLRERSVDFMFQIVGDGEMRAFLEQRVRHLDLSHHVTFLGALPNDRLRGVMAEARAFVLPCVTLPNGDHDGLPVALMEAMASEIPTISTPISGIPELITNGVSGVLVPEKDPVALADALQRLLLEPDLCHRLGQAGRQSVEENFDAKKNAAKLREVFLNIHCQSSNSSRSTSVS